MRQFLPIVSVMTIVATLSPLPHVQARILNVLSLGNGSGGGASTGAEEQRYFNTIPPGMPLPNDAECAAAIKPVTENRDVNTKYNNTRVKQRLARDFFKSSDPRANRIFATRVTGNFVGTTDEIIQWAACKWGFDENIARAQVASESNWQQPSMGDWGNEAKRCAPGHGIGKDGRPGQCPESWGLMQIKYYFYPSAWPGIVLSSAFNIDVGFAIWRACYEGYETWLNDVEHGKTYEAGDLWGCIGRWYSGRWYTPASRHYMSLVSGRLSSRIWERRGFRER